jgi:hypothetical protein
MSILFFTEQTSFSRYIYRNTLISILILIIYLYPGTWNDLNCVYHKLSGVFCKKPVNCVGWTAIKIMIKWSVDLKIGGWGIKKQFIWLWFMVKLNVICFSFAVYILGSFAIQPQRYLSTLTCGGDGC